MYLFCISCKLIVATIKVPTLVYRPPLIGIEPDDGHYRPKHVVSLLEYNIRVVVIDYTFLPLTSYTHNGDDTP